MYKPDTSPEVQAIFDRKIRELSGTERFLRGLSLTHFCREVCLSGVRGENPSLTLQELKMQFFERLYGSLFTTEEKEKIRRSLRK